MRMKLKIKIDKDMDLLKHQALNSISKRQLASLYLRNKISDEEYIRYNLTKKIIGD